MSCAHLGEQIDIHGGGSDLRFPHHENEIAQAECASGKAPFCNFWMHNGMLELDGVKMSKSLGNLVLARNLLKEYEADHLRLYLLSNHYRADADYRTTALPALSPRYGRLKSAATGEIAVSEHGDGDRVRAQFSAAMDDDFDAPRALDALDEAATRVLSGGGGADEQAALRECLAILGFEFAGARGPASGHYEPTA
jgi:cysteinyl-tRNA synthetase